MTQYFNKILGCLLGAAVGDAMGAPTETRTIDMIKKDFGGFVTDLVTPLRGSYAYGEPAGHVTDDFSLSYETCKEFLKDGRITQDAAKRGLVRWGDMDEFCAPYYGPTTIAAINRIKAGQDEEIPTQKFDNKSNTNGAAMKVGPYALFSIGDMDKTLDNVFVSCMVSHNNALALSGACSIAAAVCEAMGTHTSVQHVVEAGIYGANEGRKRALEIARPCPGASLDKLIRLSVSIGLSHRGDFETAMREISSLIGTGLPTVESVPAVFGFITAMNADPVKSIAMGVNGGADTDTVATMIGAIVGAYNGADSFPSHFLPTIDRVNRYDLTDLAHGIDSLYK